jgi:hypothetical protein
MYQSGNVCLFLHEYSLRHKELPPNLPPRGLSRTEAAAYIGISPTKFDEMVKDGRMLKPKRVDTRNIWDRVRLDIAFNALPGDEIDEANLWDEFQATT